MLEKQSETLFEPTATVNRTVETKGESSQTALRDLSATEDAARCLKDYVSAHDDGTRLFRFLAALATEVLADLNKGGTGVASNQIDLSDFGPQWRPGESKQPDKRRLERLGEEKQRSLDRLAGLRGKPGVGLLPLASEEGG